MERCKHQNLMLPAAPGKKLRCRHCHLIIDEEELAGGHCPECYAGSGMKRKDFEVMETPEGNRNYLCEGCGAVILS